MGIVLEPPAGVYPVRCAARIPQRIEVADRAVREWLLRYCVRSPLALERPRELDPERLRHERAKLGPGGNPPLFLTSLKLLDCLVARVPSPRVHRRCHFGVLA